MDALLGKITHITRPDQKPESGSAAAALEVKFKPACVLPARAKVPEWLKDQVLTIRREVLDAREIGEPGDSLMLTPVESAPWLSPLVVTPGVTYGELPRSLQIRLGWWKDEKLPEYTVRANGRTQSGQFEKEGSGGTAAVDTARFFDFEPHLPVTFEVTCDKLKAACTVLPADEPCVLKLLLPEGETYRLENIWYRIDIAAWTRGGAIQALREKGRGIDHFRSPDNLIQQVGENGGQIDRFTSQGWGWSDQLNEVAMSCASARRQGGATRLSLEGVVDEGQNQRTSVDYTLYDALPLLLLERQFHFHKGKGSDKDKEKDEKPKEPIDEMKPVRLGIRAAWLAERNGCSGSRILCTEGDRFAVVRPAQVGEFLGYYYWRMTDGWAVVEHPGRREYMLYLFDPQAPPHLATALMAHAITLEPFWPHRPVRPDESVGYPLAMTAGELCGASAAGAWVACRAGMPGGGVRCALIGRIRDSEAPSTAWFAVGGDSTEAPLQRSLVPGVGTVLFATAEFPAGQIDHPFEVTAGSIARRR